MMPDRETLVMIHTNPIVRFVWDSLRRFKAAGHDDPINDPIIKMAIEELRRIGIPIPAGNEWWQ